MDRSSMFVTPSHWSKQDWWHPAGIRAESISCRMASTSAIFPSPFRSSPAPPRAGGWGSVRSSFCSSMSAPSPRTRESTRFDGLRPAHARHPQAVLLLKDHEQFSMRTLTAAGLLESMASVLGPARDAFRTSATIFPDRACGAFTAPPMPMSRPIAPKGSTCRPWKPRLRRAHRGDSGRGDRRLCARTPSR